MTITFLNLDESSVTVPIETALIGCGGIGTSHGSTFTISQRKTLEKQF